MEQYKAYKSGSQEGKTMASIYTVERYVKNNIYPKIKFFSDNEEDYNQPNFVGGGSGKPQQSVSICNKILTSLGKGHYTLTQKVSWWVAYRKIIKKKLFKLRQADVRSLQVVFLECELYVLLYVIIFVVVLNKLFLKSVFCITVESICYSLQHQKRP